MSDVGFIAAAPAPVLFRPLRMLGQFIANVTVEEIHRDELQITEHPVEKGSVIADHAFKEPAEVLVRCAWSNSAPENPGDPGYVQTVYQQLLALQESREPFDIYTGKRKYTDMLFRSLVVTTDKLYENALAMTAVCRQVIIVSVQTITVQSDPATQAVPRSTLPPQHIGPQHLRPAPNVNTGALPVAPILGS